MGLLTDKNVIIEPPEITIKKTIAVDRFREKYPGYFEQLENLVKGWAGRHICDICSRIDEIPRDKKNYYPYQDRYVLKLPAGYDDVISGFGRILEDWAENINGFSFIYNCCVYENIYYYPEDGRIEININGSYVDFLPDNLSARIPNLWIICIEF